MTFSSLKRLAIILPIAFLCLLWVLVHTLLRSLHQFPDILILLGLVTLGVAAFAYGVFAIVNRLERQIVAQNRQLKELLVTNARLHEEALDGAVLDERLRLARELHDGVAQVLTYTNAQTLAVQRLLEAGRGEDAKAELAAMEHATRQVYGDVYEAILGLRTSLERPGLVPALRECLAQFERIAGIAPQLLLPDSVEEIELPAPMEVQLVRVVQEALANVRKHAAATKVQVRLEIVDGALRLEITDDGRGFEPASSAPSGWPRFGLQTMRERAQALSGTFELESRPGAGTKVIVTVPLVEAREGELAGLAGR